MIIATQKTPLENETKQGLQDCSIYLRFNLGWIIKSWANKVDHVFSFIVQNKFMLVFTVWVASAPKLRLETKLRMVGEEFASSSVRGFADGTEVGPRFFDG